MLSLLKKKQHGGRKAGAVVEQARSTTVRGQHGFGGGAWGQLAQPRTWLETTWENAGMFPFVSGTSRPINGAPVGYDLTSGSAVALDHISLFESGAITSPSAMVFGLNGYGKSSISGLVASYLNATGSPLAIFNPLKREEWTPLARAIGADIFDIGINRNSTKINPLDAGPLAAAGDIIGGQTGLELRSIAVANIVHNIIALIRINRGRDKNVSDIERTMIKAAVEAVLAVEKKPALGHLLHFFEHPSQTALSAAGNVTPAQFRARYEGLFESLSSLVYGDMSAIFSDEGMTINPGNPGGFDSSSIPDSMDHMISAVMMTTWRLGMNAIDAHWELSQHEAKKEAEAKAEGEVYTPKYAWRGYSSLMDEFWYPVRMAPGMVQEVDKLSRTNRSVGVGEWKITHSPKDFLMLENAADRNIAKALIGKCGLWVLLALEPEDIEVLRTIRPISTKEAAMVTGFVSGADGLNPAAARKGHGGLRSSGGPQGAGRALWKVGSSVGIPVQSPKPPTLARLHQTNTRFTKKG